MVTLVVLARRLVLVVQRNLAEVEQIPPVGVSAQRQALLLAVEVQLWVVRHLLHELPEREEVACRNVAGLDGLVCNQLIGHEAHRRAGVGQHALGVRLQIQSGLESAVRVHHGGPPLHLETPGVVRHHRLRRERAEPLHL